MKNLILGTAGHIDHGKTALVRALTGIETDRLAEEQERGITIDLGFAELTGAEGVRIGVVDVPGHEGFIRNMLAGATGMDVVLLVVAADEGVMPQTREHLAILRFLRVERLVVALTKVDLVDEEWLELVRDDVQSFLADTRFAQAPVVAVSSTIGTGIETLRATLIEEARLARFVEADDLVRLPVDRVFTIRGTGTVVTGTLWSGALKNGARVRLMPAGLDARVRGLQMHGAETDQASPSGRIAVALNGDGIDTATVQRGQTLVVDPVWTASQMLTTRLTMLDETGWRLEQGQRVRVHLGTAEVMARVAVLEGEAVEPGGTGWVQLRLESPVAARAGDHFVIRSYSPVTTIGGGRVAEDQPPKRKTLSEIEKKALDAILSGDPVPSVGAVLALGGAVGVAEQALPIRTGLPPALVASALETLAADGAVQTTERIWVGRDAVDSLRERVLAEVDRVHRDEAFRSGVGKEQLRQCATPGTAAGLVDAVLEGLIGAGTLVPQTGVVARSGFEPRLNEAQMGLRDRLVAIFREGGLAPPFLDELSEESRDDPAFVPILRGLEAEGRLVQLDEGLLADSTAVKAVIAQVQADLAGQSELGPADFREAIPVTRKHLMPILGYLDRIGVTIRTDSGRAVPAD